MTLNYSIFVRIFISLSLFCFSYYYLYSGYTVLKKWNHSIQLQNTKINKIQNLNLLKNENEKKDKIIEEKPQKKLSDKIFKNNNTISDSNINPLEEQIEIIVKKNDTFSKLINPFVSSNKTKEIIIKEINKLYNLKKLNIGQRIILSFINSENKKNITKISMPIDFNSDIILTKDINNNYSAKKITLPISTSVVSQKFTILSSLFKDGKEAEIPIPILAEIIKLYSFDIDFQRDIQKNNQMEILYEVMHNKNRRTVSYGDILYTNLIFDKNNLEYFIFETNEGFKDYFNREGKNVKKALLKTPLDGAKLSSTYGMRKHPILGYNKMHRGVDFSAPKGTPVYAAGNGIIEFAGKNGGYGNYIRIRHNNSYKTAYAHLNSFKKGISKGVRVNQNQIIGFVGSTGLSTGPHLHYEVHYQGKKINPMKMKLPSGKILKNNELKKFMTESKKIYADFLYHLFE